MAFFKFSTTKVQKKIYLIDLLIFFQCTWTATPTRNFTRRETVLFPEFPARDFHIYFRLRVATSGSELSQEGSDAIELEKDEKDFRYLEFRD